MREIVLDTETTGLDPAEGHRIIEIGCLELENFLPTGKHYHVFVNPERDVPEAAQRITKISSEFLLDKPLFSEVVDEFLSFIGQSQLIIHNAEFDLKFLNWEFARLNRPPILSERATDTARMARRRFPGAPASLDSLCRRFNISLEKRKTSGHGALLDVELLAEVYLELLGGRQPVMELKATANNLERGELARTPALQRPVPLPPRVSEEELARHAEMVAGLGPNAIWKL